jgi:hypothetical protein
MKLLKFIRKVDLLAQPIGFEDNDSTLYKNYPGALLTLIVLTVCSVISFMFGQEIYQRKNAITRYTKQVQTSSTVNLNSVLPLWIMIDSNGTAFPNTDDLVDTYIVSYEGDEKQVIVGYEKYNAVEFKLDQVKEHKELYEGQVYTNYNIARTFNTSRNNKVTNEFGAPNSRLVTARIYPCNKSVRKCRDNL